MRNINFFYFSFFSLFLLFLVSFFLKTPIGNLTTISTEDWIDVKLNSYQTEIKPNLEMLAKTKIKLAMKKCHEEYGFCYDVFTQVKIREITIDRTAYKIGNLINNLDKTGANQTGEARKELLFLARAKITPEQLVQALEDVQLEAYYSTINGTIKDMLDHLWDKRVIAFQINGKTYSIMKLFTPVNQDKNFYFLPFLAKVELAALAKSQITSRDLYQALEDAKLEIYRLTILDNLNTLRDQNVTQVRINDKTYSFTELTKPINKNKTVYILSPVAKTELKVLFKNHITKTQLDTVLTEILASREVVSKERKMKHIKIGLAASGVALALSALGGGFYWFFKIKK